jgi:hypothetical protein
MNLVIQLGEVPEEVHDQSRLVSPGHQSGADIWFVALKSTNARRGDEEHLWILYSL